MFWGIRENFGKKARNRLKVNENEEKGVIKSREY